VLPSTAMRRRLLLRAALPFLLLGAAACLRTRGPTQAVGATVPDFKLSSHEGNTVSLSSLTQKGPAVVVFYRGFW
jgi:AhpC/TSA family protein